MKKILKIFIITLLSLITLLLVTICLVLWFIFTPERITPIVRKQAEKFITCQSEIGRVELTFFSTFPDFGLKINEFALINPVTGARSDTLIKADELTGVVDAMAWLKKKELILVGLELNRGSVYVFTDSLGNTNYDITPPDTISSPDMDSETIMPTIDIRNISLNNVALHYDDLALKLNTVISDLTANISGTITEDIISGKVKVDNVNLQYNDLASKLNTVINNLSANISGTITPDSISAIVKIDRSEISFDFEGEKYLQKALIRLELPFDFKPSQQFIRLKDARASINELELSMNGTIENDTIKQDIITDISYKFAFWPVKDLLTLVPSSFQKYLEGIDVDGILSSQGSIKGILNNSVMPLMDIHLQMEKGNLKYAGFPLPLHDIDGDITFYSDLKTDALSFVRINRFNAKTPQSTIEIKGMVNHIFTDIHCDLTTNARLTLDEFNSMIPDSMKVSLKGKAVGKVKSAFSLSQLEKMQLEKMKLSGSINLSDFFAAYDSISLKTDLTKIDFALPNQKASGKNTKFAFLSVISDKMTAGKIDSYKAYLQNASLRLETSDIRDMSRIPDLICSFTMDSLFAEMDTTCIALAKPNGKVSVSPRIDQPDQPRIILFYNSEHLKTIFGESSAEIKKITIDTDILNDNSQKDIFLQWLVKGFIDMNQGIITMSGFSHPIEIPSLKMNFEPETFKIKEGKIRIDKSDFQLTGNLNNILSYFRGDSILQGNFSFVSDNTDVSQLMALTSGIGHEDTTEVKQAEASNIDTTYTGPYMVPKGIDVILTTNIKTASLGIDTISDIKGNVQIHDGLLVLDGLSFVTPAARMQLTAMYRTPRKNHLFLGLDYHMLDVEIGELLTMIPDIDTIMPMLRSFGGKGEFHIAVETYLDSMYNVKKSTLRGASSISGNNLVLMDGETFSEIAKKLNFNKKTENKVDSLSAEFTIFRNEIDVYPFLLVMDKYKVVIAGRHNIDMSFDYHVSVVDCPLPVKLGVDIRGDMENLSFGVAKCRYAEYYRPTSRHSVTNKQLELRKMIRDELTQKVKE
jgi:hypothetical protein